MHFDTHEFNTDGTLLTGCSTCNHTDLLTIAEEVLVDTCF